MSQRKAYICEMQSRLVAASIVEHLGNVTTDEKFDDNLRVFRDSLEGANNGTLQQNWSEATTGCTFTLWEMILLDAFCSLVEQRNHMSMYAHRDANKNQYMETMMLFSRQRTNPMDTDTNRTACPATYWYRS